MNITDMLTATTTANVSSGVRRPCRSLVWTAIGWPIVCRTVFESVRFSAAKVGEGERPFQRGAVRPGRLMRRSRGAATTGSG